MIGITGIPSASMHTDIGRERLARVEDIGKKKKRA